MHNNKWIHGLTNLVLPPQPEGFMLNAGVYYRTVILDHIIGEEIVLIIFDPTNFIDELSSLIPFRFNTSSVAINTKYGPIYSFIFWISQPNDDNKSFAIFDKPVDISRQTMIEPWGKFANQTHLHLLLVDKNHEVVGFYEFENNFGFNEAIETISQLDSTRVIDFLKAEEEYFNDYPLVYLYEMVKQL